jgi:nucleoside-diphosphate-sugar epimerase
VLPQKTSLTCVFQLPQRREETDRPQAAIGGTTRITRQAQEAGIKHFSIASSIVAARERSQVVAGITLTESGGCSYIYVSAGEKLTYTAADWNGITQEQALEQGRDPGYIYSASKSLAEQEVWKFADEHPDINVTTGQFRPPFSALALVYLHQSFRRYSQARWRPGTK